MNRIYKVIWNRVKNCYVVVSEIANNRGKIMRWYTFMYFGTSRRYIIATEYC